MPYNIYSYYNSHVDGEIFKLIPKNEYSEVLDIISTEYPNGSNKDMIKIRITQIARKAISVNHVDLMCIERNKNL